MQSISSTTEGEPATLSKAIGTKVAEAPLDQMTINRRTPTPHDV